MPSPAHKAESVTPPHAHHPTALSSPNISENGVDSPKTLPYIADHGGPGGGMVDALASGASTGNGVEVRVLSWAPRQSLKPLENLGFRGFLLFRLILQLWTGSACRPGRMKVGIADQPPHRMKSSYILRCTISDNPAAADLRLGADGSEPNLPGSGAGACDFAADHPPREVSAVFPDSIRWVSFYLLSAKAEGDWIAGSVRAVHSCPPCDLGKGSRQNGFGLNRIAG